MEHIEVKGVVSSYWENSSWFGTNYNMNIYKGCCHGCIYCDSRSDCYGVEDFDRVRAKKDVINIISNELRSKRKKGVIGTGAMSDPYNPFERKFEYTRKSLEQVNYNNFGISIATKSNLITRDIDVLKSIKSHSPVLTKLTITTSDDNLCKKIEPNVCSSTDRFKAIEELSKNGIFTGILFMPILPFINDTEENIIGIVNKAKESGAKFIFAYGMGVTLRGNQRDHFYCKLHENFDDNSLVRKYIETYGNSYECSSLNNSRLMNVFRNQCEKVGMLYKMKDIIKAYKDPYEKKQLSFW